MPWHIYWIKTLYKNFLRMSPVDSSRATQAITIHTNATTSSFTSSALLQTRSTRCRSPAVSCGAWSLGGCSRSVGLAFGSRQMPVRAKGCKIQGIHNRQTVALAHKSTIAHKARKLKHSQTQFVVVMAMTCAARVRFTHTAIPTLALLLSKTPAEQLALSTERRHRVEGVQVCQLRCMGREEPFYLYYLSLELPFA